MADGRESSPPISSPPKAQQHTPHSTEPPLSPLLAIEKAARVLKDWPTSPKVIRSSIWIAVSNGIFDLLLFGCAVSFLVFASFVSHYDQASTVANPRTTNMLLNATKYVSRRFPEIAFSLTLNQGPTVFPILFALILGRATHAVLRWRLERGERIGILDTLAASTSLTTTVVSQFQLRAVSILGFVLMSVWALSPIGGQASIRQMTIGSRNTTESNIFQYLVHNGYTTGIPNSSRISPWQIVGSIFVSAIVGSATSRSAPIDTWGNVKIPSIEHYEAQIVSDNEGWFATSGGDARSYSSMVGIPMSGFGSTHFIDYQMRIQSTYLQPKCFLLRAIDEDSHSHDPATHIPPDTKNFTGSGATILVRNSTLEARKFQDPEDLPPLNFQYITRLWSENNYRLDCNLSSTYVEAEVTCLRSTSCMATKVRRSRLDSPPSAWTLLDMPTLDPYALFRELLNSATGKKFEPSILERYLGDPDSVLAASDITSAEVKSLPLASLEGAYSARLGQLLNSFFTVMNGMYTTAGGLNNDSAYFWDKDASFVPLKPLEDSTTDPQNQISWYAMLDEGRKGKVWSAKGTKNTSTETIVAHNPWVITLCITSILLMFASLISPAAQFFLIRGPEVVMNMSSLATRHNPYLSLPDGGTHLGASARARLLKGLKVRFGDVEKGSNVGHLVIGHMNGDDGQVIARIRKKRLYE